MDEKNSFSSSKLIDKLLNQDAIHCAVLNMLFNVVSHLIDFNLLQTKLSHTK